MDYGDIENTEFVVRDSIVASSHLTKSVAPEVPPTAACQEAIGEANNSDIGPRDVRAVSSKQTKSLEMDSTISIKIAHLNFRALLDTGAAITTVCK